MERNIFIQNTPLEEAQNLFMERLSQCSYFKLEAETVNVLQSLGRITASAVNSRRSSPHYAASAMDGIAVKAADTCQALETNPVILNKEQFLEVDTGDYVPEQFDAVIMVEDINMIGEKVQIIKAAVPWQHIRSVGEDLVAQDMIVPFGTKIGPYELASFIVAAISELEVVRKPVVAIIPTGTELVEQASEIMQPGEIVESNSHMLMALCQSWGAEAFRHDIVPDDKDLLLKAVREVKNKADLIVICSGSSAGREDYTADILTSAGELIIHGIATRPGKPAILGIIDNIPVIGVPGYPISAQLVFELFAKPIIYKKQGLTPPEPEILECQVSRKIASSMGVDEFVYVNAAKVGDNYIAYPLSRGAGVSSTLVKSDGFICIKRGQEGLDAKSRCSVVLNRPRHVIDNSMICIGSHDMSIDILSDLLMQKYQIRMISSNVGSMGGILYLSRGDCHLAGMHLLDTKTGEYNINYLEKYLGNTPYLLINLLYREQGLIVQKGNPRKIHSIKDLLNSDIRYINRQKGAGTRVLFDYLLDKENINADQINGYNREEYTHLAVAAAIKNNTADCGLGIYASARALNLEFIPVSEERYDLCLLPDLIGEEKIEKLLQVITSSIFKSRILAFGGYNLRDNGKIIYKK